MNRHVSKRRMHSRVRSVTTALRTDVVRSMSMLVTLGARPEMDIWPDDAVDRAGLLRSWTRSGDLTVAQAEILATLDETTAWRLPL